MTASTWIATIALLIAIFQLSRTLRWNQMNAALTWFDPKRLGDIEKTTDAALQKIDIKYQLEQQSLTAAQAAKIIEDPEAYAAVKYLLNYLHTNAAAVRAGAIDERFAFQQMRYYYFQNHKFFAELISQARILKQRPGCWDEIDALCKRWSRWENRMWRLKLPRFV
jgi:hypothetical protein